MTIVHKFCSACGSAYGADEPLLRCSSCGVQRYESNDLLTMAFVYAGQKLLLIRRGLEPYRGKWALPGGFMERGEAVEDAAAREVLEETGVAVDPKAFIPHGVISLPALNQVHICVVAMLDAAPAPRATEPEILDARWFEKAAYPRDEIWAPAANISVDGMYRQCETGAITMIHQTDSDLRLVHTQAGFSHPWIKI